MLKRPLDPRFRDAVLEGRKITTIRDKPWRTDVPIMLYNWSGAPYRSKQIDVAPIIVEGVRPITITHPVNAMLHYEYGPYIHGRWLWEHEGFLSRYDMDDWFSKIVKPGETVTKILMRFRLANASAMAREPLTPKS